VTPRSIVLASNSPRRKALLEQLRLPFKVIPILVNESRNVGENPKNLVERLSEKKARSVGVGVEDDCLIIAADTVINLNGKTFGKPFSKEDGFLMLRELSGKVHKVHTGVCMVFKKNREIFSVQTDVYFRELTDEMINWYWSLDESRDKAGSYAIQGAGSVLVEKIVGSYSNVVGLPLKETADMLGQFGVEIFKDNYLNS
jgi:septum formation protein